MPVMLEGIMPERQPWWELEPYEWSSGQFRKYVRYRAILREQKRKQESQKGEQTYQRELWEERGHEEWGESPCGSEGEIGSCEDDLDVRSATIIKQIWGESSSGSESEPMEFLDERRPRLMSQGLEAAPATGGKGEQTRARREPIRGSMAPLKPARRIGPMSEERRRKTARGVRGLGFEGRGIVGMSVTYHEGPIAIRMNRKCNRNRNTQFTSGVKLDPDVEADRARVRAIALMEEVRLEKRESDNQRELGVITEIVIDECRELGITINAGEAAVKKTVEAVSAIAWRSRTMRRKWMIDSGWPMDLISERELLPEELAMAKRVKNIKFNTANGGTWSEKEVMFSIEPLLECVFVRILKSTPGVLSMGMRCMGQGYSFHWPAGQNPIFVRPDRQVVHLTVLGDIPYLTNARSIVEEHRESTETRILSAMPAPTVLPSKWEKRIRKERDEEKGMEEGVTSCSNEEAKNDLENISSAGNLTHASSRAIKLKDQWGFVEGEVKRFHYAARQSLFNPLTVIREEPWMKEVIMTFQGSRITHMKTADGRKLTVRDDWVESMVKGTKSIAETCAWVGKTYFKVNEDGAINEKVRAIAEGMPTSDDKDEEGVQIMGRSEDRNLLPSRGDSQNLARVEHREMTQENNKVGINGSQGDKLEGTSVHKNGQDAAPGETDDDVDLMRVLLGEEAQEDRDIGIEAPSGSRDIPVDTAGRRDAARDEAPEIERDDSREEVTEPEQDREARIEQANQRDRERRMRKRSGDPNEAGTTQHLLTHYPKNIHCVACRQAKVTNVRFTRRAKPREVKEGDAKFGRRVTADTIVLRNLKDRGIGGETNAIVFYDLYSGWIDCIPVRSRVTEETVRAINQFKGPDDILGELYTDQAGEFSKACGIIGACNGTATPNMPRTNGIAESRVKEVLSGARYCSGKLDLRPSGGRTQ